MSTALATLTSKLAQQFDMGNGAELSDILKQTAFKSGTQVTDAQMTALLVVANQYGLNPFTKEIFAFPDKGGIVPVVGVDGWARIMNNHPQFDGMEFSFTESSETIEASCTCKIYRKDRSHAVSATEYLIECKRDNSPAWKSHPRRMLRHKSMIQAARLAFGFGGIYDQDEAERIVEIDTQTGEIKNKRPTPQSAAEASMPDGYAEYEDATLPCLRDNAMNGTRALQTAFSSLPASVYKKPLWAAHGEALKSAAAEADSTVIEQEAA